MVASGAEKKELNTIWGSSEWVKVDAIGKGEPSREDGWDGKSSAQSSVS